MFTDQHFSKLFNTPGIRFSTLLMFRADPRLVSPFSIINDAGMKFGEYETYPDELAHIAYHNGF